MATGKDVADVADRIVAAKRKGLRTISIGLVTFDLTEWGMCARFVRECHEAALGFAEHTWPYKGDRALAVNENLKAAGLAIPDHPYPPHIYRERGDVICFSGGKFGHVAIWLGAGMVAENTSSGKRGDPRPRGTKITPLADIGESRIIGWYRPLPPPHLDAFAEAWQWAMQMELTDGQNRDPVIGRMLEILRRYAKATTL